MTRDVNRRVWIRRSPDEVADYLFDPLNETEWAPSVVAVRPDQPGVLETGDTFQRTSRFLGFTLQSTFVVTSCQPRRMLEVRADSPYLSVVRYRLTPEGEGTTVQVHMAGRPGRFFGWLVPFVTWQANRTMDANLARLKALLER